MVAAVVPEVEMEIRRHQKFGNRFEAILLKHNKSQNIAFLESKSIRDLLNRRAVPTAEFDSQVEDIQNRARIYRAYVHDGEAYSHAHATALRLPLMSHDNAAIETLTHVPLPVAIPVLRYLDVVVFAYKLGTITEEDGERIRQTLLKNGEYLSQPFDQRKSTFADCVANFSERLRIWEGDSPPPHPRNPRDVLHLVMTSHQR